MTDPMTLLRAADPAAELTARPPSHLRERIVAAPTRPARDPRRARRWTRRVTLGATAATALAGAIVVSTPWTRPSSADVVARAAQAYVDPHAVVHFRLRFSRDGAVQPLFRTEEVWQTVDARRERTVLPNGLQFAHDLDARTYDAYAPGDRAVRRASSVDSGRGASPSTLGQPGDSDSVYVGDVAALLRRARDGEDGLRYVGEATVDGTPAYELRLTYTNTSGRIQAGVLPGFVRPGGQVTRTIYLDRRSYLPVRLTEVVADPEGRTNSTTVDFLDIEEVPSGPRADQLLEIDAPAGTPTEVDPPFDDSKAGRTP